MTRPEVVLILARAANGVIGKDGALPWRLPADLRHFKALTAGTPMVMGRKTFVSLPGLLPGRRHIVLTRDPDWRGEGAEVAHDVPMALALAGDVPRISVIGGAEIYRLFLDHADRIELTEIEAYPEGDTFIRQFADADWQTTHQEPHPSEGGFPAYRFLTLERVRRR